MSREIKRKVPLHDLPKLDALLIHGHGYNQPPDEDNLRFPRPAIRGRLSRAAGERLVKTGLVENVVFAGAALFGHDIPLSLVNAKAFQDVAHLPDANIHRDETARTTSMEQTFLLQEAEKHGWSTVGLLSVKTHEPRVALLAKKIFPTEMTVYSVSVEDVLDDIPRYKKFIRRLNWTLDETRFKTYELINRGITRLPYGEKVHEKISQSFRPHVT